MGEGKFFEKQETEPNRKTMVVDFLRHGATKYTDIGRDLTAEGEKQIRESAKGIIDKIDPNKETVVLWSSPAVRAQGSEDIIKEMLAERNIEPYKDLSIPAMRSFEQKDREFMENFWQEAERKGVSVEALYAKKSEFQTKNDKFETQVEVRKRTNLVFRNLERLAKLAETKGKVLHIIGVSHFEFLNPLAEDIFGTKTEEGEHFVHGEDFRFVFEYDPEKKDMGISAEFRGQKRGGIYFNGDQNKFCSKE